MSATDTDPALVDLDGATCSTGAPSARNLIVTVFGDVLLPIGPATEVTVQELAGLLADFGVNERLVRTSLSRLVQDGLLAVRPEGRRSYYRVSSEAVELFAAADEVIYRGRPTPWDGQWTTVVLDGGQSTAEHRAALRQHLTALGLGSIAPNVLGAPLVPVRMVVEAVEALGGVEHLVVTRGALASGVGIVDAPTLAARCLDLDGIAVDYARLADRLGRFGDSVLARLDPARASKLRLLVVATFRRVALADPRLPDELLPSGWPGHRARAEAARVYGAVVAAADAHAGAILARDVTTDPRRFSTPRSTTRPISTGGATSTR